MNELRRNPITREWVIYRDEGFDIEEFLHRFEEVARESAAPAPGGPCGFCRGSEASSPGAIRTLVGGKILSGDHPDWSVRVIPDRIPIFRIEVNLDRRGEGMLDIMSGKGAHEIIIESPDHLVHFADMDATRIASILSVYRERMDDLERDKNLGHLFLFKNEGITHWGTMDHVHSQLIASPMTSERVKMELDGAREYYGIKERCIFCDLLREQLETGEQVLLERDGFVSFVPPFASSAFEIWILPRDHDASFKHVAPSVLEDLAATLRDALARHMHLLGTSSFSLGLYSSPNKAWGAERGYWRTLDEDYHWHFKVTTTTPSRADIWRGFSVGTGLRVNPIPPEKAAELLKQAPGVLPAPSP